jgi:hypothetical protein
VSTTTTSTSSKTTHKSTSNATTKPINTTTSRPYSPSFAYNQILIGLDGIKLPVVDSDSSESSPNLDNIATPIVDASQLTLCPYYEKNGECPFAEQLCEYVHGNYCELCSQYALHPFNV